MKESLNSRDLNLRNFSTNYWTDWQKKPFYFRDRVHKKHILGALELFLQKAGVNILHQNE